MIEIMNFFVNGVSLYVLCLRDFESTILSTVPYRRNRTVRYSHGMDYYSGILLRYGTVRYCATLVGLFRIIEPVKVMYIRVRYDTVLVL